MERLAKEKHSSLLGTFVNYGRQKFYKIGPRSSDQFETEKTFCPIWENFDGRVTLPAVAPIFSFFNRFIKLLIGASISGFGHRLFF
jgi:hypothetical protein